MHICITETLGQIQCIPCVELPRPEGRFPLVESVCQLFRVTLSFRGHLPAAVQQPNKPRALKAGQIKGTATPQSRDGTY